MGPFNSSTITPSLKQRGIAISQTCEFETEELFQIINGGYSSCRDRFLSDTNTPSLQCTSVLNITRAEANSNVQLQCSVRPLNCTDTDDHERFTDRSSQIELRLQGTCISIGEVNNVNVII